MTIDAAARAHIEARHAEVLGQPPRVAPCDRDEVADQVRADTAHLMSGVGLDATDIPLDSIPEIMFTMCRYPDLWRATMDLTFKVQGPQCRLPLRDRKLAILRTGWLCQAPYEFGEHVNQSKRLGFTSEEIERIVVGSDAPGWSAHERAVLCAVEELHGGAMVSDATWGTLAETLDDGQIVELVMLVGQFTATAYFQNAMRLRLEAGNAGLMAR